MANERASARPLGELDKATRERLEAVLSVDPANVTDGDRGFLQARRDYLTADQRADYLTVEDEALTGGDRYEAMKTEALKEELKARGLAVGGKVDELRDRLRADDAHVPTDEEETEDDEDGEEETE